MVADDAIAWSGCTWEGARREYVRRYRRLTLRQRLEALEEMCDLGRHFHEHRRREGLPVIPLHRDDPATAAYLRAGRRVVAVREATPGQVMTAAVPRQPLDERLLQEIVRRVVEVAQPDRIILFGSAARGELGPDSDVDLLVIKSGVEHRGWVEEGIYMNLFGVGVPVDVVVVTPGDVARFGHRVGSVIRPALREGREIYAA